MFDNRGNYYLREFEQNFIHQKLTPLSFDAKRINNCDIRSNSFETFVLTFHPVNGFRAIAALPQSVP